MGPRRLAVAALAFACGAPVEAAAQAGAQPGDPMRIAIVVDNSQRITDKNVNALLNGLTRTGVLVNAVLLTSSGVGLVRSIVLEMIKRTGGAHESVIIATALSAKMKVMAGRVAQQYNKVSPDKAPAAEFRRSAPQK